MHLPAPQLAAASHLADLHLLHSVEAASGARGLGRFLIRRLLLHGLLRSGGWILVMIVIAVLVAASQFTRRRR